MWRSRSMRVKGKIVVFEGPEGCGKSTQAKRIYEFIKEKNNKVILLREPGGTVISEKIRDVILDMKHKEMSSKTELLLYIASRAQIIHEKIKKLLEKGYIVLLDRFFLATVVYQGYARGLDIKMINSLNKFVLDGIKVDKTIIYDVSMNEARKRMKKRSKHDRLDAEREKFHVKVRVGYLTEAKKMKKCTVISTDHKAVDDVFAVSITCLQDAGVI
jgi:dTMP kinase